MTEPSAPPTPNQPPLRLHARRRIWIWESVLLTATVLAFWIAWKPLEAALGTSPTAALLLAIAVPIGAAAQLHRHHYRQRVRAARCAGQAVEERDVLYLFPPETVRNYKLPGPDAHPTGFAVRTHFRVEILENASLCFFLFPILLDAFPPTLVPGWSRGLAMWLCVFAIYVLIRWWIKRYSERELPGPDDCQHCGYRAVRSLESRRCPECGMVVEDGAVVNEKARVG